MEKIKRLYLKSLNHKITYLIIAIIFGLSVLTISLMPYEKIKEVGYPTISDIFDMINHFIGFCIFNYFLISTFIAYKKEGSYKKLILIYLVISIIWGLICECSQIFNPTRKFQFIDIIANTSPPFIIVFIFKRLFKL